MTTEEYAFAIEEHKPKLLFVARAFGLGDDAEDVVQNAVAYCLAHLTEYNPRESSLKTWVTNIIRHRCANFLRDERIRRPPREPEGFDPLEEDTGIYRRAQSKPSAIPEASYAPELDRMLDAKMAFMKLDRRARDVLWGLVVEGYTATEFSKIYGYSRQRILQIYAEAIEAMKCILAVPPDRTLYTRAG